MKEFDKSIDQASVYEEVRASLLHDGYDIVEVNETKPWGAYYRMSGEQADMFISQYFPGLSSTDARMGADDLELSPKILVVKPSQRLSWQYHGRRAECWRFLTDGAYISSMSDEQQPTVQAASGEVVQFACGERHRLIGVDNSYVIVAEIWQHVDPLHPSDEDDIVRLQDDYKR